MATRQDEETRDRVGRRVESTAPDGRVGYGRITEPLSFGAGLGGTLRITSDDGDALKIALKTGKPLTAR